MERHILRFESQCLHLADRDFPVPHLLEDELRGLGDERLHGDPVTEYGGDVFIKIGYRYHEQVVPLLPEVRGVEHDALRTAVAARELGLPETGGLDLSRYRRVGR